MKENTNWFKRFLKFLRRDSWSALVVTLLLAFVIIKFAFFPLLSLVTGTGLPLVIVESCSMYHHQNGLEQTFTSPVYDNYHISLNETKKWIFQNGFSKGDIIFVVGPKNIEIGDVIIFNAGTKTPIIHRVISIKEGVYSTKGDNYLTNAPQLKNEMAIQQDQIIGKALFRVPFIGWAKLIFFEFGRPVKDRGMC